MRLPANAIEIVLSVLFNLANNLWPLYVEERPTAQYFRDDLFTAAATEPSVG